MIQEMRDSKEKQKNLIRKKKLEFLKWRERKFQYEREEERIDNEYEKIEDAREFKRYNRMEQNDRRDHKRRERYEDKYERYEDDREYERKQFRNQKYRDL